VKGEKGERERERKGRVPGLCNEEAERMRGATTRRGYGTGRGKKKRSVSEGA